MKAGEWLYLCVAHGTDGAMEVRLSVFPLILSLIVTSNAVPLITFSTPWTAQLHF